MTTLKHNSGCGDTTTLLDQTLVSRILLSLTGHFLIKLTFSKNRKKSLLSEIPDHT